ATYLSKPLLRAVAARVLPPSVQSREKTPFASASSAELAQSVPDILDLVSPERLARQQIFQPEFVRRLAERSVDPDYVIAVPIDTDWLMVVLTYQLLTEIWPDSSASREARPEGLDIESIGQSEKTHQDGGGM